MGYSPEFLRNFAEYVLHEIHYVADEEFLSPTGTVFLKLAEEAGMGRTRASAYTRSLRVLPRSSPATCWGCYAGATSSRCRHSSAMRQTRRYTSACRTPTMSSRSRHLRKIKVLAEPEPTRSTVIRDILYLLKKQYIEFTESTGFTEYV